MAATRTRLSGTQAVLRDALVTQHRLHRPCPKWLSGWQTQPDGSLRREHDDVTATVTVTGEQFEITVESAHQYVRASAQNAVSAIRHAGTLVVLAR